MRIQCLSRSRIDIEDWNRCVSSSTNRIIYAYSWYLDTVTDLPNWRWEGLVFTNPSDNYLAVMPVPLRRKFGMWVVHQPLFCQFLGIFGANVTPDLVDAFARALLTRYRYGSIFHLQLPNEIDSFQALPFAATCCHTHLLGLSADYETIYQRYSSDTRRHLRQAQAARWHIQESTDPSLLLALFRQYHANQIPGGVGEWAYGLFENILGELQKRGLATLQYTVRDGETEAGAVFVAFEDRIIYLFNAASELGRKYHARTLLIDGVIRKRAGCKETVFDFESPFNQSIAQFYRGFGAAESPFWAVRWNRLPWIIQKILPKLRGLF